MVQVPQAAAAGLVPDEYDYDLIPISVAAATAAFATCSNVVPDGYTLKVARMTLTNKNVAGIAVFQIVSQATGVVTPYGGLGTQTVFEQWVPASSSLEFSEDQLEFTVPAGFNLQVEMTAGTLDVQLQVRYLRGGVV
jgi:hypothetical protein